MLINRQWIHSDYTFRGVDLTPETIGLKDTYPDGVELRRLNRLLLEEAYPAALRQPVPPTTFGEAGKPVPPTTFGKLLSWVGKTLGVQEDLPPPTPSKAGTSQASPTSSIAATNSVPLATPGKLLRWAKELWDWIKEPNMPDPFHLTGWVCMVSVFWIVFSPIWVVFGQIRGQKKSSKRAGSDSSVEGRDRFERTFGVALLGPRVRRVRDAADPGEPVPSVRGEPEIALEHNLNKGGRRVGGCDGRCRQAALGPRRGEEEACDVAHQPAGPARAAPGHPLRDGLPGLPRALQGLAQLASLCNTRRSNRPDWGRHGFRQNYQELQIERILAASGAVRRADYWNDQISFPLWSHEGPRNYYFNYYFVLVLAIELWVFCRLSWTSI